MSCGHQTAHSCMAHQAWQADLILQDTSAKEKAKIHDGTHLSQPSLLQAILNSRGVGVCLELSLFSWFQASIHITQAWTWSPEVPIMRENKMSELDCVPSASSMSSRPLGLKPSKVRFLLLQKDQREVCKIPPDTGFPLPVLFLGWAAPIPFSPSWCRVWQLGRLLVLTSGWQWERKLENLRSNKAPGSCWVKRY